MARILVVEDEVATRTMILQALVREGHEVDDVADGVEAIGKLTADRYAVVLLDLQLPRIGGIGVLECLARRDVDQLQHVIVVTGLDLRDLRELFPICATLTKPVSIGRLLEQMRACMEPA